METAALIIVAGAAAVAAGLGFAAGWAGRRWLNLAYPAYWFAIGGAALGVVVGGAVIVGWPASLFGSGSRLAVQEVLPNMAAIKKYDERLYERVETSIIRDQQDGKSAEEARANAKALVSSYVADKIPFLSNELVYELYATTRDILAHLNDQDDHAACADVALGRFKGDIDSRLSPELIERNDATTLRVIAAEPDASAPKMPAETFGQLVSNAFAEASHTTGIAPEEVARLLAGEGDTAKTCKLMRTFIDRILAQPIDVAASALRTLAAGGGRTTN